MTRPWPFDLDARHASRGESHGPRPFEARRLGWLTRGPERPGRGAERDTGGGANLRGQAGPVGLAGAQRVDRDECRAVSGGVVVDVRRHDAATIITQDEGLVADSHDGAIEADGDRGEDRHARVRAGLPSDDRGSCWARIRVGVRKQECRDECHHDDGGDDVEPAGPALRGAASGRERPWWRRTSRIRSNRNGKRLRAQSTCPPLWRRPGSPRPGSATAVGAAGGPSDRARLVGTGSRSHSPDGPAGALGGWQRSPIHVT